MKQGFEDAFTDAQSGMVSLFLELLEGVDVDKIYIYAFQNEVQSFFNGFVEKDGEVVNLIKAVPDGDKILEYFEHGINAIDHIVNVCKTYSKDCPNLFKLIYNVETGAFDADYGYEDIVSEDKGLSSDFLEWREEIRKSLQS